MSEPTPRKQVPSVGRVVHYTAYGTPGGEFPAGVCRASIITQVLERETHQVVGLCVLNPTGQFFKEDVPYSAEKKPGTFHWPEFVSPA